MDNYITATVLWPLCRLTCVSRHSQLKVDDFVEAQFYCHISLLTATSVFRSGRSW